MKVSPSSSRVAYASPIAASASAQITPPWSVPIGFACSGRTSISKTASPSPNETARMPSRVATGGGGTSPRSSASRCSLKLLNPAGTLAGRAAPTSPRSRVWIECEAPGTITSFPFGASAASCLAHSFGVERSRSPLRRSTGTAGSRVAVSGGAGVSGQFLQVAMIPLPAAVAGVNGQVACAGSVTRRPVMNAWRFVVAVPHGKRRSEQSVAACRPALKSSVGAPEARWTFVSSPRSGLRSPLRAAWIADEHAGVVRVGELVLDDQVEELHAVHAVADEPRDVGGGIEAAGSRTPRAARGRSRAARRGRTGSSPFGSACGSTESRTSAFTRSGWASAYRSATNVP